MKHIAIYRYMVHRIRVIVKERNNWDTQKHEYGLVNVNTEFRLKESVLHFTCMLTRVWKNICIRSLYTRTWLIRCTGHCSRQCTVEE